MVVIKIILLGSNNFFPCMKHVAAIVTDIETGRQFLVNHPFGSYGERDPRATHPDKAMRLYQQSWSNICVSTTTLCSDGSYQHFLDQFGHLEQRPFAWLSSNCANVINELLDFFFPDNSLTNLEIILQMQSLPSFIYALCFPVSLILSCTLSVADVITPAFVFEKASALDSWYGLQEMSVERQDLVARIYDRNRVRVVDSQANEYFDRLDESAMKFILRPLGMI